MACVCFCWLGVLALLLLLALASFPLRRVVLVQSSFCIRWRDVFSFVPVFRLRFISAVSFCSETDKINRYIINSCFAFVDFVHISIAFMKSWYCFFVFASRFVLLFLFMFVFFSFWRGGLLIYELILFVLFT